MPLNNPQAALALALRALPAEALSAYAATHRADLLRSFMTFRRWTPRQEQMVRRWIDEANRRQQSTSEPAQRIEGAGLDRIHALFARARSSGLRWPRVSVRATPSREVDLSMSADGQALHVRQGRTYLGSLRDGIFRPTADAQCTAGLVDEIEDGLRRMAADPAAEATAYGRLTGNCCFCRRALTDGRSVAMGYGPICAGHYGLPWGDERAQVANVALVETPVQQLAREVEQANIVRYGTPRAPYAAEQERAMDRMFQAAEQESEERGFRSDPDFRSAESDRSWRNELAR